MTLIRVASNEINYWDSNSIKNVLMFNMLKAIVSGKTYAKGAHEKLIFKIHQIMKYLILNK